MNHHDQARTQPGLPKRCSRTQRILALTPIETASEPARFSCRTDPCCAHVATSHAFETAQDSGKDAVTAGIAHSNPIATHRIRHATGFLQTTLSKLPRRSAQQVQLRARGSPDRVLTFIRSQSDDGLSPTTNESISLFSSIVNAWSGHPFIKSTHDLHELASQQDERAPQ
jgi:hypothetical protein